MKKATEEELFEERDAVMRQQYFHPIENFPDKIDQLLDALNRVCFIFVFYCLFLSDVFFLKLYMSQMAEIARMDETTV